MTQPAHKRRICSYDMVEVSAESFLLVEEQGEMYFCNARCLGLWAVHFVTNPHRPEEQKNLAVVELSAPSGERRRFAHFLAVAQWSAANALQGDANPWLENGTKLD
jgi:hypothetical protein